jgi:hypothetical protein
MLCCRHSAICRARAPRMTAAFTTALNLMWGTDATQIPTMLLATCCP